MKITRLFNDFFESEKASGLILIFCTLISLILANSLFKGSYAHIWHITFANHPLEYWINDGLMTIFFLLIGLELEREIYHGELSSIKNATLPLFAAIGGMLVPAGIKACQPKLVLAFQWLPI
jgi:NhaA family Na+:H+ antiporter